MKFTTTSRNVYLVKFRSSTQKFIIQDQNLLELLKANPKKESRGIDFIKIYDNEKQKFKTLAKTRLKLLSSWETELTEVLKNNGAI